MAAALVVRLGHAGCSGARRRCRRWHRWRRVWEGAARCLGVASGRSARVAGRGGAACARGCKACAI
eukprot:11169175-Lingulodinium_polyedra.AAC.1